MDVDRLSPPAGIAGERVLQWSHVLMDVDRLSGVSICSAISGSFNGATS